MASRSHGLEILGCNRNSGDTLRLLQEHVDQLIPFVGAGLSTPFGYPTWRALLLKLSDGANIRAEIEVLLNDRLFEEAAERLCDSFPTLFDNSVRSVFDHAHLSRPLNADSAVLMLPQLARGVVITTNFDRVLELAFEDRRAPFDHVFSGVRIREANRAIQLNLRVLLKLHGDYFDSDSRVLTLSEYVREYGHPDPSQIDLALPLPKAISQALSARPLLFLGSSLEDDRTTRVIASITRRLPGTVHFALISETADLDRRAQQLDSWGILPLFFKRGEYSRVQTFLKWVATIQPLLIPRPSTGSTGRQWQAPVYLKTCVERFEASTASFVSVTLHRQRGRHGLTDSEHLPEEQLLSTDSRLLLLAEPGAGKTSLLERTAMRLASRAREVDLFGQDGRIPILVHARSAENSGSDLLTAVAAAASYSAASVRHEIRAETVSELMSIGRVVLLLDGLNEVVGQHARRTLIDRIIELSQQYPDLAIVVTCRARGFDDAANVFVRNGFSLLTQAVLDDHDVADYLRLHGLTMRDISGSGWRRLPRTFQTLRVVSRLSGASAASWVGALRDYVQSLWSDNPPRAATVWTRAAFDAVTALATELHTGTGMATRGAVVQSLANALGDAQTAQALFEQLTAAGLLASREHYDSVAFDHEQFRFYFVAHRLVERWRVLETQRATDRGDDALSATLKQDAADPVLEEPYSFAIGLLALNPSDETLLAAALDVASHRSPVLASKSYGQMPKQLSPLIASKRQAYLAKQQRAFIFYGTNWGAVAISVFFGFIVMQFVLNVTGTTPLPTWYYWLVASLTPVTQFIRPERLTIGAVCVTLVIGYLVSVAVGRLMIACETVAQRRRLSPLGQSLVWLQRRTARHQLRSFANSLRLPLRVSSAARVLDEARHHLMGRRDLLAILRSPASQSIDQILHALSALVDSLDAAHLDIVRPLLLDPRGPVARAALRAALIVGHRYRVEVLELLIGAERQQSYLHRLVIRRAIGVLRGEPVTSPWPTAGDVVAMLAAPIRVWRSWSPAVITTAAKLWALEKLVLKVSIAIGGLLVGILLLARACE